MIAPHPSAVRPLDIGRPLLIRGARLLDPASGTDQPGDLLARGGRIVATGGFLGVPEGVEVVEARGLCLAPGLVDARVRFGEPGEEHKERLESGVRAAAAGGVTSVVVQPDTTPAIDDPAMLEFVARKARQLKSVKVHPQAALTRRLEGRELCELALLKEAGAVAFGDAGRYVADAKVLSKALAYAKGLDALIVQLPEEPSLAAGGQMNAGETATRLGLSGLPSVAEVIALERDLRLVEHTGARYHAAVVSCAGAVEVVRRAKERGLPVTCGTTPHHLALNELEVEGYRTFAKIRPPLRTEEDRLAVIEGIKDGTIDLICSDHRPQDQDSKRLPFAQAAFGVIGVETLLPISLKLHHESGFGLLELLTKLTVAPAKLLGLEAGTLAAGAPADLVLFDPDEPWKITEDGLSSLAKNTAFEGRLVQGRVRRTFVDGRTAFRR